MSHHPNPLTLARNPLLRKASRPVRGSQGLSSPANTRVAHGGCAVRAQRVAPAQGSTHALANAADWYAY
ncbi:MAG: hypothetical protein J0I62_11870, partial [Microbacterium sp.]|nr:hypothetical protein [Microbacterium sp.]